MPSRPDIPTALITGGNGFLGLNIAKRLLATHPETQIHLLDLRDAPPSLAKHPRISSHTGNITDPSQLSNLITQIQPTIIFHSAALTPQSARATRQNTWAGFDAVNVQGTRNVLSAASACPAVKALVFTSSVAAINPAWTNIVYGPETLPYPASPAGWYHGSKALAEKAVLKANGALGGKGEGGARLRTCALRLVVLFGEGDPVLIPVIYQLAQSRVADRIQVGRGESMFDVLEVTNAAHAHVLAGENLLAGKNGTEEPEAAGQVFNITNCEPLRFQDFIDATKARFGVATEAGLWKLRIPVLLLWVLLVIVEVLGGLFGLQLNGIAEETVESTLDRWYDCGKAKEVLGYEPLTGLDDGIARACEAHLRKLERLKTQKP